MQKKAVPPKTKAPPSDSSEEETGSSDEETEDEAQAEGGSGFESGSDESMDLTKNKPIDVSSSRQPSAVKAAAPGSAPGFPAKRTRQSIGKEDEPASKRSKPEVTTAAPKTAPKAVAQQLGMKRATKAGRVKSIPPGKEKPSTAEKKSATKRNTTTPAPKTSVSNRSEDKRPQKPKSLSQPWSEDEELALSRELKRDRINGLYGSSLPSSRSDPYWDKLVNRLSFLDKYEKLQRIERLCEKIRRMRLRYESLIKRLSEGETSVYKNVHEAVLWRMWHTIWGPHEATLEMLDGGHLEGDYEDEEEEEDGSGPKGSEEEDESDIVPIQVKGRKAEVGRTSAKKKVTSTEVVVLDGNSSDESPVKATPPALVAASAETSGAGMQGPLLKSVPTKGPAVSAMDEDSGRNTSRVAVQNGAQGGHALVPEMIEKSGRSVAILKVSDEMRAENLALLRDMSSTCVKMVEEAKAYSLLVTEKILEETRVKTTQIVEEARVKTCLIMEELRLVIEKLGTFAGQSGETNGALGGRWSDMYDNPFQGMGLLGGGKLPSGDPNDVKWREISEAEQGLIIQRLQLVQEQARIQQEGIRLKLNIQKQQQNKQA